MSEKEKIPALREGDLLTFKAANVNSGSLSINGRPVVHPDGRPVTGGDLQQGRVYEVRLEDGVLIGSPNRAERRGRKHKKAILFEKDQ